MPIERIVRFTLRTKENRVVFIGLTDTENCPWCEEKAGVLCSICGRHAREGQTQRKNLEACLPLEHYCRNVLPASKSPLPQTSGEEKDHKSHESRKYTKPGAAEYDSRFGTGTNRPNRMRDSV